jgi:hypothetical protein
VSGSWVATHKYLTRSWVAAGEDECLIGAGHIVRGVRGPSYIGIERALIV